MAYSSKIRYVNDDRIVFVDENGILLSKIKDILKDNAFKTRENDYTEDEMEEYSKYDAYKIIKTVEEFLNK